MNEEIKSIKINDTVIAKYTINKNTVFIKVHESFNNLRGESKIISLISVFEKTDITAAGFLNVEL